MPSCAKTTRRSSASVIASFIVSLLLSFVLARWIADPIRKLAFAADEAASGPSGTRIPIPDLSGRHDEVVNSPCRCGG